MSTPPSQTAKPKQSCAPGIVLLVIIGIAWAFISNRCKEVERIHAEEQQKEAAAKEAEVEAERLQKAEREAKLSSPISSEGVPSRVEELSKNCLGRLYLSSKATYDSKMQGWDIEIVALTDYIEASSIKDDMLRLAAAVTPKGMKVSQLVIIYKAEFTDGLGHKTQGDLVRCGAIPGILDNVNWGNRSSDIYGLDFDKIFITGYCHRTFRPKWNAE